jgi:hypothetical protein
MDRSYRLKWHKNGTPATQQELHLDTVAPHEMFVSDAPKGTSSVVLEVIKPKESQTLGDNVPFCADTVAEYWRKEGWHEIEKYEEGEEFFAIRYIPLPSGYIVWVVDHKAQVPNDKLKSFPGTLEQMIVKFARVQQ